jgi:hypothetical protein
MVPWIRIHGSARADRGCETGACPGDSRRAALAREGNVGREGGNGREGGEAGENEEVVGEREPNCSR